jgi:sugar phosphate isomerase/epimerase
MKLACADFTFPLLEHGKVLDLIAALDFEGVDIGLFEGRSHLWPSKEFKNLSASARALKKKLDACGLACADVFLQMAPSFIPYAINQPEAARRRKARDWFLKTLEYSGRVGARHVTTLPGVLFETRISGTQRIPETDSWKRSCEELGWRVQRAKEQGITFSIEAHVGSIVPEPKSALRLVKAVPGLTLTLDYTHFTRAGLRDSAAETLIPYATHFHARGARKGRLQAAFPQNTVDYARVVRTMKKNGYKGYIGVEYVWIDWEHCNEVDNLSETIQMRDFLRKQN